jgi:phenylalanyl-tRNA synthetase beta chain
MKLSEQWLREWANPDVDTAGLAEQLTMAGLEVDSVTAAAPSLDNVVVGKVTAVTPHPNADKLNLCKVDVGSGEDLVIVCGAANVKTGNFYPVAMIGARLPGGLKIKRSKIRGTESFGMLCSSVELGLADSANGLMELDDSAVVGASIVSALGLDDHIIDLDLTPNRADCFSVVGVGRDIAAYNDIPFDEPDIAPTPADCDDSLPIKLAAEDACPVFAGRIIRNINPAATTPLWMTERLRRAGVRALHPVVDVTNYVMLELGQPMHGYDLDRLDGEVSARWAKKNEPLKFLDEQIVELTDDCLVIANAGKVIGLAGIMGGYETAVTSGTQNIFLESAWFTPASIAGKARRFGLHTEASMRFERGVDFNGQLRAIERATELLLQIVGGQAGPAKEQRNSTDLPARNPVELRRERLAKILGVQLADAEIEGMLKRLGMQVERTDHGWRATPISARFDITIEVDLVEEIARLHGYDTIPEIPQKAATHLATFAETQIPVQRACEVLVDRGYHEAITYSFVDPERQKALLGEAQELELANPLSTELSVMRRSLWVGLLDAVAANSKRQQQRLRLFESGIRFISEGNEIKEENSLSGIAWGHLLPEDWAVQSAATTIFDIKSDIAAIFALTGRSSEFSFVGAEHSALCPGRSARIERNGVAIGWIGELHPRVARLWDLQPAPVIFELSLDASLCADIPSYQAISRFPSVRRDLAVLVPENLPAAELVDAVRTAAGKLLRDITVFDIFTGKGIETGLKSVALGLILQVTSRTLTDMEIDEVVDTIKVQLSSKFNASIRE